MSASKVGKEWFFQGRQRYCCKSCGYHYSVQHRSNAGTSAQKKQALELYSEGEGLRSIGRTLGFSHVTIYHWIKAFRQQAESLKPAQPKAQIVEADEMPIYIKET